MAKSVKSSKKARAANKPKSAKPGTPPGKAPSLAVRRACFLEILRRTCNVSRALRETGLASSSAYGYRLRNKGFAAEWDRAMTEAVDAVEEALIARARDGVEKPVYYGGALVGTIRTYSDKLGMFILQSRRPEVYNRVAVSAPSAGAGGPDVAQLNEKEAEAEFDRRMERLGCPQ